MLNKKLLFITFLLIAFFTGFIPSAGADPSPMKTLRIGTTGIDGLIEKNASGTPEGYGVEYLEELSKYTGWHYIFIEDSWSNSLQKLQNHEIDLLLNAQYTPERAQLYEYAKYPSGIEYCGIYVRNDNQEIFFNDYAALDGLKIGVIENSFHNVNLATYAKSHGFTYHPVYYHWPYEAFEALDKGSIDAVAVGGLNGLNRYKIVAKFGVSPFFFITGKGNSPLMQTLNLALDQLKCNNPTFEADLYKKYYGNSIAESQPLYSREEAAYIQSAPTLAVGYLPDQFPLTYFDAEKNEMQGIYGAILKRIEEKSGLHFKFIPIQNTKNLTAVLKEKSIDLVIGKFSKEQIHRMDSMLVSDALIQMPIASVVHAGLPIDRSKELTIALTYDSYAIAEYLHKTYPQYAVLYEPDVRTCLDAVKYGRADITMHNYYAVNYLLHSPHYENLTMTGSTLRLPVIAAGAKTADPRLISIIDKTMAVLSKEEINQLIFDYIVENPYEMTFSDFIYKNSTTFIFSCMFLILTFILGIYALLLKKRSVALLRERKQMLTNITNNINGGVIVVMKDVGFTITYANEGFLNLLGYTKEEFCHQEKTYITYVHPDDINKLNQKIEGATEPLQKIELELRIRKTDGTYFPALYRGTLSYTENGQPLIYCVVVDNTKQQTMLEELQAEKERYKAIIENSDDILFDVDLQNDTVSVSPQLKKTFGLDIPENCTNAQLSNLLPIHPDDMKEIEALRNDIQKGALTNLSTQVRIQKSDGTYIWCQITISIIRSSSVSHCVGKIRNIDAEIAEKKYLEDQARIDQFTGLYNKQAFLDLAQKYLAMPAREEHGALVFIDIDNFKQANDQLGHLQGDRILKEISGVLKNSVRQEDIIGRFGGDEFCLLLKNVPQNIVGEKMKYIGKKIHKIYANEEGIQVEISASIGIAMYEIQDTNLEQLIQKADAALYQAKSNGKNQCILYKN